MSNSNGNSSKGDTTILIVISVFALLIVFFFLLSMFALMDSANSRISATQGSNPVYNEVTVNMNQSLEETAVLHPSFFAQDKEIVLGGKNEADFSGNGVLEDAEHDLNQDFYLHKTAIVGKYNDSLEPSAKEDLLNATTTVRISKGTYSLGDKIVNE